MFDDAPQVPLAGVVSLVEAGDPDVDEFSGSRWRMEAGFHFEPHSHEQDQLAWMSRGSVGLVVAGERWQLHRESFAWLPAGAVHAMDFDEPGELVSVYADPALRPHADRWSRPHVVQADALASALMLQLSDDTRRRERRLRCHALLTDILDDAPEQEAVIALPRDERARLVALALLADPADHRDLDQWGRAVGVSAKTIARAFAAETGHSFRAWRTLVRVSAAAGMLRDGQSVRSAADDVGYDSTSSFITTFKLQFGMTPARYAARAAGEHRAPGHLGLSA
ncbi:AraC family transcriptional regulator [Agromyces atrinae]|uniref:helix-turn-helix transcriptional regulator n=1 Tax=Agromyces atrinae TaxID=592376 RepID=UPI001F596249|nr:AraC family transcriptional regulator [Agromyces atrinae]MCI2958486.1 AraC family transcriptional regulator [Agromyces atrinae]